MISQEEAIKIAEKQHGPGFEFYKIGHGVDSRMYGGNTPSLAPDSVWCVLCLSHPGKKGMMLASSRAIVIHKETGKVLYDGSAGDEG
jgi:D-alanyl-D-alanine carboxypeptidase